jgi:hypothetical protein
MFTFASSEPINDNFVAMGYDTNNILQTLDTILAFLIGLVFAMIMTSVLSFVI